jgi:hypothetical protein
MEGDLNEIKKLNNPILSGNKEEFLNFDLQKIETIKDFVNPELRAGLLLLKIIRYQWAEFIAGWSKIKEILNSREDTKKIYLEGVMLAIYLDLERKQIIFWRRQLWEREL